MKEKNVTLYKSGVCPITLKVIYELDGYKPIVHEVTTLSGDYIDITDEQADEVYETIAAIVQTETLEGN